MTNKIPEIEAKDLKNKVKVIRHIKNLENYFNSKLADKDGVIDELNLAIDGHEADVKELRSKIKKEIQEHGITAELLDKRNSKIEQLEQSVKNLQRYVGELEEKLKDQAKAIFDDRQKIIDRLQKSNDFWRYDKEKILDMIEEELKKKYCGKK